MFEVPLEKTVYIDRKDFKEDANPKKYFGLTKRTPIRLKHAYKISYVSHETDASGTFSDLTNFGGFQRKFPENYVNVNLFQC